MAEIAEFGGVRLTVYDRQTFLSDVWDYSPGEHVTFIAPTGWGKTTLQFQLLGVTATQKLPSVTLGIKPRDRTLSTAAKTLDHRIVRRWPPPSYPWQSRPAGWILWPKHSFDPDRDDAMLYMECRRAILDCYKTGDRIVHADELAGLSDLGLDREMRAIWGRGRSMHCAMWGGSQRPVDIPVLAYGSASHLFLGNDPDERSRKRYDEIGGVAPRLIREATAALPRYWWLYVRRDGPALCVITA